MKWRYLRNVVKLRFITSDLSPRCNYIKMSDKCIQMFCKKHDYVYYTEKNLMEIYLLIIKIVVLDQFLKSLRFILALISVCSRHMWNDLCVNRPCQVSDCLSSCRIYWSLKNVGFKSNTYVTLTKNYGAVNVCNN